MSNLSVLHKAEELRQRGWSDHRIALELGYKNKETLWSTLSQIKSKFSSEINSMGKIDDKIDEKFKPLQKQLNELYSIMHKNNFEMILELIVESINFDNVIENLEQFDDEESDYLLDRIVRSKRKPDRKTAMLLIQKIRHIVESRIKELN